MPMCKKPKGNGGNVVKGPWPDIKISDVDGVQVIEELNWAENLTEGIMVQMIQTLKENDFDVADSDFLRDVAFAIEVIKGIIYRNMGHEHPLHDLISGIVKVEEILDGEEKHINTSFDFDLIKNFSDYISVDFDGDGPNTAWF